MVQLIVGLYITQSKVENINNMIKKYPIVLLLIFSTSCISFQQKIYKLNKEYNEKKKIKHSIDYSSPECPDGASFQSCGSGCGPPTCGDYYINRMVCPDVCVADCFCTGGKVLDYRKNKCVEREHCSYSPYNY